MKAKNLIKLGVLGLYGMATLAMTLVLDTSPAMAHGERSQEPFLRMRTIQWYDMKWGPETTKVNDFASMTGKFHLA
jgi:methane/ammonia monooxygenase subunit B